MQMVELRDIVFQRGNHKILQGISWTIEKGQHWAMLGANGSGKTTLLKVLTGYEWPTAGSVSVFGRRYGQCDLRDLRKAIGWVSVALESRLRPRSTALEAVASGLDATLGLYRSLSDEEWRTVGEALERVNGTAYANQSFETLSQGERQRVLIARSIVNEPALLVLDEPCAGLDPGARESFLEDLRNLAEGPQSPTILFVTHHVEEIGPWITHVHALMEGGTIAQGSVETVLTGEVLSRVFSRPCTVERNNGAYSLRIGGA